MGVKKLNPTTPSRRNMTVNSYEEITTYKPEKSLIYGLRKSGGRNSQGKITVRHRGGGNKKKYRIIDFKRDKDGVIGIVKTVEYDPNRSVFISLIFYMDGDKRYILAPSGMKVGDRISSGIDVDIKPGNCLPLANIPVGTMVHNIEIKPGKGGQIVRSAGLCAQLMAKDGGYATLRLPSGEMRYIRSECRATIGVLSNESHSIISIGKAGRNRFKGIRPTVRGSVMNPCDHPHGGGEGKSPIGRPGPVSPWGVPTLGYKTRKNKKYSNNFIIRKRS